MARKKSQKQRKRTTGRAYYTYLNKSLFLPSIAKTLPRRALIQKRVIPLSAISDRRIPIFRAGPPKTVGGSTALIASATPRTPTHLKGGRRTSLQAHRVRFAVPRATLVCIRRSQRRQVLHALNKTGSGKGKQRKPRRNDLSEISCR